MIVVAENEDPLDISKLTPSERALYTLKNQSSFTYTYHSMAQLTFELKFRLRIIDAAKALLAANVDFAAYAKARCNWKYWIRTAQGGFQLRPQTLPSAAIRDIYISGGLYAFECATAMVIVLYKAMLDMIGAEKFNLLFADLLLWDWNYDSDLHLITIDKVAEAYPGDILYFANPDYSQDTPEWQGENVVKLAEDLYYGHGIGNKSAKQMIQELNTHRVLNSRQSAYLKQQATYPDYPYLFQLDASNRQGFHYHFQPQMLHASAVATIGTMTYIKV